MNILNFCNYKVHPAKSGGPLRVSNYNSALSEKKDVSIEQVSFSPDPRDKEHAFSPNNGRYTEFIVKPIQFIIVDLFIRFVLGIEDNSFIISWLFEKFIRPNKFVAEKLKKADVIQLEQPFLFSWVKKYSTKPVIIIAHNVEYVLIKSVIESKLFRFKFSKKILKSIYSVEKQAMSRCDYLFVVSEQDKKNIMEIYNVPEKKIKIIHNGIHVDEYSSISEKEGRLSRVNLGLSGYKNIILFTGSFYQPNIDAAEYIEKEVAPEFDEATLFLIAGSVGTKKIQKRNVLYTGFIETTLLKEYFKAANIAINPMVLGSGSNIKMFEYFASGLPVVTTPMGARGVHDELKENLVLAELGNFSAKLKELINDPQKQAYMSKTIYKKSRYHDYSYITEQALCYYNELKANYKP